MKPIQRKKLFILAFAGIAFCLLGYLEYRHIINQKSVALNSVLSATNKQQKSLLPVRFKIPRITVNAKIEYAGLTPDGAMDNPKEKSNVAWFSLGTIPGQEGTAVIAGHSGYKVGKVPFDTLETLRKGDKVYVENAAGESITFVVRESRSYDADANAPEVFTSNKGTHLNLITCAGIWDASKKTYNKRYVVFTDIAK
jgi:sortase A